MATAEHFYDLGLQLQRYSRVALLMWLFYSLAAEARFQEGPFGQVRSMQCKYTPPGNEESTCDTELLNTF